MPNEKMNKTLLRILAAVLCSVFVIGLVCGIVTACVNISEGNTGAGLGNITMCLMWIFVFLYIAGDRLDRR